MKKWYELTETDAQKGDFYCESGKLIKYFGVSTDVVIPDDVCEIGSSAFNTNNKITSIVIPNSVQRIGFMAFANCTALKKVRIGAGVKIMDRYVFSGCTSLEEITIPGNIHTINFGLFKGCSSLRSVTIEEGVRKISEAAFCKCNTLETITLPSTIRDIGPFTFSKCMNLRNLVFTSPTTYVAPTALYKCREDIIISWRSKEIYNDAAEKGFIVDWYGRLVAFFGTQKNVIIPNCVKTIGRCAFSGREEEFSVVLTDKVLAIEPDGFAYAKGLKHISFGRIERLGESALWGTGLHDAFFPDSLTEAGKDVLGCCSALKKVTFEGKNVSFKGRIAPMCYELEEVIFPSEQDSLPDDAFYACRRLKKVFIPDKTKLGKNVFDDSAVVEVIHAEKGGPQ